MGFSKCAGLHVAQVNSSVPKGLILEIRP